MSPQYPVLDGRPIDQLKVTELREELKKRNLSTKGLKSDLIKRLDESFQNDAKATAEDVDIDISIDPITEVDSANVVLPVVLDSINETKDDAYHLGIDGNVVPLPQGIVQEGKATDTSGSVSVAGELIVHETLVDTNTLVSESVVSELESGVKDSQDTQKANRPSLIHLEAQESEAHLEAQELETQLKTQELEAQLEAQELETQLKTQESEVQLVTRNLKQHIKTEDTERPHENTLLESSDLSKVSEVKPILGIHVESDSISTEDLKHCIKTVDTKPVHDAIMLQSSVLNNHVVEINPTLVTQLESDYISHGDQIQHIEAKDAMAEDADAMPDLSVQNTQVSEVTSTLGIQVKSDSICTVSSVSINQKNKLKDNIIAEHVVLDLENVTPEMLQPLSNNIVKDEDKSSPMDINESLGNKFSIEDEGRNNSNAHLSKKNDREEVIYSEKLNLDRSSCDDSMEEDVLDGKQIDSIYNSGVGDNNAHLNVSVVKEEVFVDVVGDDSPGEKDSFVDSKNIPAGTTLKRKPHEQVARIDLQKRQRRWNTEPNISNVVVCTTPKDLVQPSIVRRNFSRSDSSISEKDSSMERVVPSSQKPLSNSLRIDRFVRPFTLKAVQELLAKTGTVDSFWMDHIKTHCYVTYSSVEEAVETRNAVFNLQWPPNGGHLLVADFVDPREVKIRLEPPPPVVPINKGPTFMPPPKPMLPPPPPPLNRDHTIYLPPPPPLPIKQNAPIVTLDDLFKKTKAIPRIYYLPLSEERIEAKRSALTKQ